jgi:hypothetical protein
MPGVRRTIGEQMNNWGIPDWLEKEVRERDKTCVYCGIQLIEKIPVELLLDIQAVLIVYYQTDGRG